MQSGWGLRAHFFVWDKCWAKHFRPTGRGDCWPSEWTKEPGWSRKHIRDVLNTHGQLEVTANANLSKLFLVELLPGQWPNEWMQLSCLTLDKKYYLSWLNENHELCSLLGVHVETLCTPVSSQVMSGVWLICLELQWSTTTFIKVSFHAKNGRRWQMEISCFSLFYIILNWTLLSCRLA